MFIHQQEFYKWPQFHSNKPILRIASWLLMCTTSIRHKWVGYLTNKIFYSITHQLLNKVKQWQTALLYHRVDKYAFEYNNLPDCTTFQAEKIILPSSNNTLCCLSSAIANIYWLRKVCQYSTVPQSYRISNMTKLMLCITLLFNYQSYFSLIAHPTMEITSHIHICWGYDCISICITSQIKKCLQIAHLKTPSEDVKLLALLYFSVLKSETLQWMELKLSYLSVLNNAILTFHSHKDKTNHLCSNDTTNIYICIFYNPQQCHLMSIVAFQWLKETPVL